MTLLMSTDEQLSQRGYPGMCSLHVLSNNIHVDHEVHLSHNARQRLTQDREQPRPDFSMSDPRSFNSGREHPPPGTDPDTESDFEVPTPRNTGIAIKKGKWYHWTKSIANKKGRWYPQTKKPDLLKPDDKRMSAYACPLPDPTYADFVSNRGNGTTCCMRLRITR
jgi:hypothetical protein